MFHTIEISSKTFDARTEVIKKKLNDIGFKEKINKIYVVDVYVIDKKLNNKKLHAISHVLCNPVTQNVSIDQHQVPLKFSWAIELSFLPGVTDNIAHTCKELIENVLKTKFIRNEEVYTSQIYYLFGSLTRKEIIRIADSFYNSLIQKIKVKSYSEFKSDKGMKSVPPRVALRNTINLKVSDQDLASLGKEGIINPDGSRRGSLALDIYYLKAIGKYFNSLGRNPTDLELESIAQTWSEHCKHTIFADPIDEIKEGLFNEYIKKATDNIIKKSRFAKASRDRDFCVSVFTDNSGAIEFDEHYLITHKVETHNSPSALDPFGGAITGIVGVNRDTIGFGMGAKPTINTYGFCFADPTDKSPFYKGKNFTQKMLEPRRIMDGVIEGVNSGGNCSGIPTPQGFMVFDKRYKGKPLVYVGTVGLIPKKINGKKSYIKKAFPGDYIVMVGGQVGLDGIHGATFSSEAIDSRSPVTAVQIGDPITQKKLSDAIVKEARDLDLYNSITDNGAGGLSCSVAEMAKESGGCLVKLDDVPLKYPGLAPWQIWISESQERMTLAVPKNKWKKFFQLMKSRGVEATIIGKFTRSGKCVVKFHEETVMDVDMKFLHNGLPKRQLKTTYVQSQHQEPKIPIVKNLTKVLLHLLQRNNISGFEFLSMQYDHEVQGGSVLKPLHGKGRVNSDATIIKPILDSFKGVVLSQGLYPTYSDIDTYHMAACAIDTAIRNAVVVGADPNHLALLDNFCWCNGNDPERLGQLKRAAKACYDYAVAFETPFISGKDSMFNDFKGFDYKGNPVHISIPPTLLISSIGVINDVIKAVSIDLKFEGDLIYVLGETDDELGASEYFSSHGYIGNNVPKVNAKKNKKLYQALFKCIHEKLIASAISVGRGGLGVALAKTAMAGMLGIDVSLKNLPGLTTRDDFALFSESQGRIIVSINPKNKMEFEKNIKGNIYSQMGVVRKDSKFLIKGKRGEIIIRTDVGKLLYFYKKTFKNY